jgi:TRAP-type uncharacterized transport system fused permease subunit
MACAPATFGSPAGVSVACACAGIIVGTITLTGLGLKLGNGLVGLSGGNLILTLIFTMISSLILGMGAPTTANYIITSTIAAHAIVMLGVPVLAAHMFTFYFGIIADITPPVALAAFAGPKRTPLFRNTSIASSVDGMLAPSPTAITPFLANILASSSFISF